MPDIDGFDFLEAEIGISSDDLQLNLINPLIASLFKCTRLMMASVKSWRKEVGIRTDIIWRQVVNDVIWVQLNI